MTRGVLALFRGDVSTSFAYHPLAVVLVIEAIVFAIWKMTGRSIPRLTERSWLPVNLIALLVVFAYRSTYGSFPVPGSLA